MKKMILNPRKDTVTICIPPDWVGRSVVCILKEHHYESDIPTLPELHDVTASYNTQIRKRQSTVKRRTRVKHLRSKRVGNRRV